MSLPFPSLSALVLSGALAGALLVVGPLQAQAPTPTGPVRNVLVRSFDEGPRGALAWDVGALGAWQRLQKLRTVGSVLYTAGHPDDEEAGVLTLLSRGEGIRTALLTLNRGEGGANAIGAELFDALGLIRSEELRLAGRYYGLDDQYYTAAADYGYSKTLDEAFRSWDREALLEDMVRIIRTSRPLVVMSRWHGSERDGHGHHQAVGVLTPEAVEAAADPARFPDQITTEGLRPWRVRKLYRGRIRAEERHHLAIQPRIPSPSLGLTYQEIGARGLSLQRSQTAGRLHPAEAGPPARYERLLPGGDDTELDLMTGLPTGLSEVFTLTGEAVPPGADALLAQAEGQIRFALAGFDLSDPSASAPYLATARERIDRVLGMIPDSTETAFILRIERVELDGALLALLGVRMAAVARTAAPGAAASVPVLDVAPGQDFSVHWSLTANYQAPIDLLGVQVLGPDRQRLPGTPPVRRLVAGAPVTGSIPVRVPASAAPTMPWYRRSSISQSRYQVVDSAGIHLGEPAAPYVLRARFSYAGHTLEAETVVRGERSTPPYGSDRPAIAVVPPVSLRLPGTARLLRPGHDTAVVSATVVSRVTRPLRASVEIESPEGWRASPSVVPVELTGMGDEVEVMFELRPPPDATSRERQAATFGIRVAVGDRFFGYEIQDVHHRDLAPMRLYRDATVTVAPVDVEVEPELQVGYVMGVGDLVPDALAQLGAHVTELTTSQLETGELGGFDAILVGTRAYAVRPDLEAHNERLIEYARDGGNLVVLYQTPEYDPGMQAPYPATLPSNAEEVSEEDAGVTLLNADHLLFTTPNAITDRDFGGWIEQRGSKFFSEWDSAYTPLVETHDRGQAPQRGVWLTAPVGDGHFTYLALALHRQLPYGVPGAYRILANSITPRPPAR